MLGKGAHEHDADLAVRDTLQVGSRDQRRTRVCSPRRQALHALPSLRNHAARCADPHRGELKLTRTRDHGSRRSDISVSCVSRRVICQRPRAPHVRAEPLFTAARRAARSCSLVHRATRKRNDAGHERMTHDFLVIEEWAPTPSTFSADARHRKATACSDRSNPPASRRL